MQVSFIDGPMERTAGHIPNCAYRSALVVKEALRLSTPAKTDFCHNVWCEALMLARREITMPGRPAAWQGEEGCIEYPFGV